MALKYFVNKKGGRATQMVKQCNNEKYLSTRSLNMSVV
jgi:hypothetical protein